jgi:threonylcarbamoyladenosine tRNA methylthiotransferase MtaB
LEPADVTERLLDVFSSNRNIMPHLHLPVQSGSERILKHMRRQYTVAEFVEVVDAIRRRLDRPAITTDIIVGFPGETKDDFEQTIELAKKIGFAKMHVFRFSPREGTAAAKMQKTVNADVIKRRSSRLRGLDKKLGAEFRGQFLGERVEVLVEKTQPAQGRCERYFMVELGDMQGQAVGQVVSTILR